MIKPQVKSEIVKKRVLHIGYFMVAFFGISWGGLSAYCRRYANTIENEATGKIYPENFNGYIVYLTQTEYFLLHFLFWACLFTIVSLILIDGFIWDWAASYFTKSQKKPF